MSVRRSRLESAVGWLVDRIGVRSVHLEVTQACNQICAFCYNVWKCTDYPEDQFDTEKTKDLIDRIIRGYHPQVLTFTGGEPLLRDDLPELIGHASKRTNCNLISNGTLMTDKLALELVKAGVKTFEFTLLSADRGVHNTLVGRDSFDQVIEAIATVRAAGGNVATTFVAMKDNIETLAETIELNVALGVRGMLFNRYNVGGAGIERAAELMPTIDQMKSALAIANESVTKYGISISCGVPFPPCVIDRTPYKNLRFGDCPVGTRRAYPTVDAAGNVRPCNHSPTILGNLFDSNFSAILLSNQANSYAKLYPEECKGCKYVSTCRGGCRAAAEVCGNSCGIDPFVKICQNDTALILNQNPVLDH